jgi:hypothetical protein
MKNPSSDDPFSMKGATDEEMADFLGGFKNKPDNPYSASPWEGMRKRIKELNDKIQAVNTAKNE